jgi:hypothetical protein
MMPDKQADRRHHTSYLLDMEYTRSYQYSGLSDQQDKEMGPFFQMDNSYPSCKES